MHKSCRAKEVCADLNSPCAVTSSLNYWHKMVLYAFPNFCLSIPPLLVAWHLLHRCFSQAIARLFFKWLLPADVPQSPGVCVCCPLHWAETQQCPWHIVVPLPLGAAGSMARHSSDSSAAARLLGDTFPSATGLPAPLLAAYKPTTWAAQSSFLCCLEWTWIIAAERVPKTKN